MPLTILYTAPPSSLWQPLMQWLIANEARIVSPGGAVIAAGSLGGDTLAPAAIARYVERPAHS